MADGRYYYATAIVGVVAAVPLSAMGWWDLLPASVADTTKATVSSVWFLFCIWAFGFTFWTFRNHCEDRAVREYRERREGVE